MNEIVVYAGTFDPVTNGHLDIVNRTVKLFEKLVILVVPHPEKSPLFSLEERMKFIKDATKKYKEIEIASFDGLLMNYMKGKEVKMMVRGLRAVSDFDYEFQMVQLNRKLYPKVETLFIMPGEEYFFLSSSMIKEIAAYGGDVSLFTPRIVSEALKEKFHRK